MTTLSIPTAQVFAPLLEPARYKGAWGGRGSGKSRFFSGMLVESCVAERGTSAVCIREVQRTLAQSSKRLVENSIIDMGLGAEFKVWQDRIETPGDGVIIFQGMQDHTAESIKSLEGFKIAWTDEAQTLSARSLSLLRPTIRVPGSELWFSWNPRRKSDAIDDFLRGPQGLPPGAVLVKANWRDNPWWNETLEAERKLELERYPERYDHTYEGDYARAFEGAYFAKLLAEARAQGRIGRVVADPLLPVRAFVDIGGAGANADAFTIWIVQWVGQEIRVLDYYEAIGQVLAYHLQWLRDRGYQNALIYLPHDGVASNNITGKRYEDHLRDAGFKVEPPVANQGRGAAAMRIEAVRRLGPKIWFNEATTEPGRDALGFYHEHKDEARNIGLGPEHDWCLAAGTEVLTPEGWREIQTISVHDQVSTPFGSRRVLRSGIVRMTREWTDVKGIRCTPEHRFFTNLGLVESGNLSLEAKLWTRDSLGLRILGFLCAIFRLGFKEAIIWVTPEDSREVMGEHRFSFTAWCMRLCTVKFLQITKSIILMVTRSIIPSIIWLPWRNSRIEATINQSQGILVFAGSATVNLAAIKNFHADVAGNVSGKTTPELSVKEGLSPAYNLTVERDECYFVKGADGLAYLVSNSSHAADAFGLMAICYQEPSASAAFNRTLNYASRGWR